MNSNNLFRHSGRFSVPGLILAFLLATPPAVLLGAVYGVIIKYSPFPLANVIVTALFGIAVGLCVAALARVGKIRNITLTAAFGIAIATIALLAHWIVWLRLALDLWILDAAAMWTTLKIVAVLGPWSVFGWAPTGGVLFAIWALEASLVLFVTTVVARDFIAERPFCERTRRWASVSKQDKKFAPFDVASARDRLQAEPASILEFLTPPADDAGDFVRLDLASVPESDLRTVTVNAVSTRQEKDKVKEESRAILRHLVVDPETFERLSAVCAA